MSEVKPELKQCSRCNSTCTLEHFEKNRKGERFKLCNNCRGKSKQWRDDNKKKVQHYNKLYIDKHNPLIECSYCKCLVRHQIMDDHRKGYQCNVFDMDPKPDYHEWLFEHQATVDDTDYIKRIQQTQNNIISWKHKKYGTSSAVSDDRLKEILKDTNDNIDYIWNWKEGPNSKIQINKQ